MKTAPASTSTVAARGTEHRRSRRLAVPLRLLLVGSAALLCGVAHAEPVRKCHVEGRLVFQSTPCAPEARATAVAERTAPAAAAAPAGDADSPPKKKTLADLLRERDGADRARAQAPEAPRDGAKVLRERMGAV